MSEVNLRRLFLKKCFSSALQLALIPVIIEGCTAKKSEKEKKVRFLLPEIHAVIIQKSVKKILKKDKALDLYRKRAQQTGNVPIATCGCHQPTQRVVAFVSCLKALSLLPPLVHTGHPRYKLFHD